MNSDKPLKVLHIVQWYPNADEPYEASFIREHVRALGAYVEDRVIHLRVRRGHRVRWIPSDGEGEQLSYDLELPVKRWRFVEWATTYLLFHVLRKKLDLAAYDLVNFHIAYPLCVSIDRLRRALPCPFLITEHWTAYHFNFHLPQETRKLDRIKRIFCREVPLITVSDALRRDIEAFSGCQQANAYVVPNVVDTERFFYDASQKQKPGKRPSFLMLNYWRAIKSPFVLLDAFRRFLDEEPDATLRVGGYGPLWEKMERYVHDRGLEEHVRFLGRLNKDRVASEMQRADAFIHAATYETFSVVCAEALCCGTPVGVTHLPALSEFIHEKNGVLVREEDDWKEVFNSLLDIPKHQDPQRIAKEAQERFSPRAVGDTYYRTLMEILEKKEG